MRNLRKEKTRESVKELLDEVNMCHLILHKKPKKYDLGYKGDYGLNLSKTKSRSLENKESNDDGVRKFKFSLQKFKNSSNLRSNFKFQKNKSEDKT